MKTVGMGAKKKEASKADSAGLKRENKKLTARVEELEKENKKLTAQVAELEAQTADPEEKESE